MQKVCNKRAEANKGTGSAEREQLSGTSGGREKGARELAVWRRSKTAVMLEGSG